MLATLQALFPVFGLIVLGAMLKRYGPFAPEVWRGLADLCYFVLFPVLLVTTLARAELAGEAVFSFGATLVTSILVMTALLLALRPFLTSAFGVSGAAFTSLFQGVTRWHGFIGLTVSGLLFGDEGLTYIAIAIAIFVPLLNLINVTVLALYAGQEFKPRYAIMQIVKNPFITACAIGIAINVSGITLPGIISNFLIILGDGALGLGLITVGAGLQLKLDMRERSLVLLGAVLRLGGMPALMFLSAYIFGVEGVALAVAVIAAGVPTASTSYVLAQQMGGDAPLMASIITAQVMAAVVSLPVILWLAGV